MDHDDKDDEELANSHSKIAALKQEVNDLTDQHQNNEMELITFRNDRSRESKNMKMLRYLITQLRYQIILLQVQLAACK